jgi:drug/metabolite transporter (DMT)-like permease
MTLSMAGFAVEDAFIKAASARVPVGQILIVMGLIGVLVFRALAKRDGQAALPQAVWSRTMAVRSGFELGGRLFYALAIAYAPLISTSAILQATPLVVVPAAALLFGEKVGALRLAAVGLGFAGVLVVLRPGLDGFNAVSLLALAGMLGFAGRDLATRAAPLTLSTAQLGVAGFGVLAVAGGVIAAFQGGPVDVDPKSVAQILGASVFGIIGYAALTRAMRTGEVSAVTPFRYTRLVFAMVLALVVFRERPDLWTLVGSALIVSCGLLVLGGKRS